jgi:hypothetical protein
MKYKDIVQINEKGLLYKSEERVERFIDFESCKNRFVDQMAEQNQLSLEAVNELKLQSITVAWRDITAKPMYIEFLSDPPVKIEFPRTIFGYKPYRNFSKLKQDINDAGWATFDLS